MNKVGKSREIKNKKEVNLMKIKQIVSLFFIVIFLAVCKEKTPFEPSVSILLQIKGVVTDVTDEMPINDVYIYLHENHLTGFATLAWTSTDEAGRYFIKYEYKKDCSYTEFVVAAKKYGYHQEQVWTSFSKNGPLCTDKLQTIDIQLEPY